MSFNYRRANVPMVKCTVSGSDGAGCLVGGFFFTLKHRPLFLSLVQVVCDVCGSAVACFTAVWVLTCGVLWYSWQGG